MRIVFFGTPEVAVPYLGAITDAGHEIAAVVTQPDSRGGRGRKSRPSAVKEAALEMGLPALGPESAADAEFVAQVAELAPEAGVVVAYGQILKRALLAVPSEAFVNVHYSLLPLLRGAAPVYGALRQGLRETGVTVQHLARKMDAGDIILQRTLEIMPEDNRGTLTDRLTEIGTGTLVEALELIASGEAPREVQDHEQATVVGRVVPEDCRVDWNAPATETERLVRACTPWPGAWCMLGERRIKLAEVRDIQKTLSGEGNPGSLVELCSDGTPVVMTGGGGLAITRLQPPGKQAMSGEEFMRGARLAVGDMFE